MVRPPVLHWDLTFRHAYRLFTPTVHAAFSCTETRNRQTDAHGKDWKWWSNWPETSNTHTITI